MWELQEVQEMMKIRSYGMVFGEFKRCIYCTIVCMKIENETNIIRELLMHNSNTKTLILSHFVTFDK